MPSGRNTGHRCEFSPFAMSTVVKGSGTLPVAKTLSRGPSFTALKRITPSSFHVPPRPAPTSQITVGKPPTTSTRQSLPAAHVTIVCAGKLGRPALEDVACAGWLCAAFEARGAALDGAGARFARSVAPADSAGEETQVMDGVEEGDETQVLRRPGPLSDSEDYWEAGDKKEP